MSLVINNNVTSLTAQRNLGRSTNALNLSLERLSSGMRINRAADNPAGLVTSEKQRAQIAGLNQAIENTERGVSMVQTAEGALNEINTLLTKIRGLALDSANTAANDDNSLAANQREIEDALASIDRISTNSQFGSQKLFDGSNANTVSVTDGSDSLHMAFSGSTLATGTDTVTISGLTTASYTVQNASTVGISAEPSSYGLVGVEAGDHTVKVTQASDYAQLTGTVDITDSSFALAADDTITIDVDGTGAEAVAIQAGDDGATGIDDWVTAINNAIDASTNYSTTGADGKTLVAARAGTDNVIEFYTGNAGETAFNEGSDHSVVVSAVSIADAGVTGLSDIGFGSGNTSATGQNAIVEFDGNANTVTSIGYEGTTAITLEDADGNQVSVEGGVDGLDVGTAIVTVTAASGSIALSGMETTTFTAGEAVSLTDSEGNTVDVTVGEDITADGSEGITIVNSSLVFQIGANKDQTVSIDLDNMASDQLAQSVTNDSNFADLSEIDVTTSEGAQSALDLVDEAISEVSVARGDLGSFQANTLESNLNNLRVASENMVAAESTLRDTDFAAEMAEFTKNQILLQAGMTVLSNATQVPQNVLSLLR